MLNMGMNAIKAKFQEKRLDIDWQDYNYPPGLKIIHYKPQELEDGKKIMVCHLQHIAFLLIPIYYIVNFISCVIDVGYKGRVFSCLYSVLHVCLAIPVGIAVLSKCFRSLAFISNELNWYKYGEFFMIAFGVLVFVCKFLCYHGVGYVFGQMYDDGWFLFTLGLIELILVFLMVVLRVFCVCTVIFKFGKELTQE